MTHNEAYSLTEHVIVDGRPLDKTTQYSSHWIIVVRRVYDNRNHDRTIEINERQWRALTVGDLYD